MEGKEDLRLMIGDRGSEFDLPAYLESPTWILDKAWDRFWKNATVALNAYMNYCRANNLPHSYLLGLDILVMGEVDAAQPGMVVDIRPTMVEGPCCNSYPACPNLWAYRLYRKIQNLGLDPDRVDYPNHPTNILKKLASCFWNIWKARGNEGTPRVGIFTRPYEESEEETAHIITQRGFEKAGLEVYRITPEEKPEVRDGYILVSGKPMDMCYRRIERIHVPLFYGERLGNRIIREADKTLWVNPWKIDDLRSKTIEERCFRLWEGKTEERLSRPKTLLDDEIHPESVRDLANRGGFAVKKWNSTGGKGVFLNLNMKLVREIADKLYLRYNGRHMALLDEDAMEKEIDSFADFKEDTSIQQMRLVDARPLDGDRRLAYDTRINVLYNELDQRWEFLSGISRVVACGDQVVKGNSLLTNISAGAEISPLVVGYLKDGADTARMTFGPLLKAMMDGKTNALLAD